MKLTLKQKKFADEYLISGNATEAAIKAGYSKRTAKVVASQNLTKLNVKNYIAQRMKEIDDAKIADQKEVLEFLTRVVRREETEQVVVTLKKPVTIQIKGAKGAYNKQTYEDVDEVVDVKNKLSDSIKAAEVLGKLRKFGEDSNDDKLVINIKRTNRSDHNAGAKH